MATKKELLQTFEKIVDIIDRTSGLAGLNELANSNLPAFIQWYENNIQYCSPESKMLGKDLADKLKDVIGGPYYKGRITQEYLKEYAKGCTPINANEESCSLIFAGAMRYASFVFGNHLVLGGTYNDTKNYQEILDHLQAICKIIGC